MPTSGGQSLRFPSAMHGWPKSCATNSAPIPPKEGVTEIGGVVTVGTVVAVEGSSN